MLPAVFSFKVQINKLCSKETSSLNDVSKIWPKSDNLFKTYQIKEETKMRNIKQSS